jgi:hypothetical protein
MGNPLLTFIRVGVYGVLIAQLFFFVSITIGTVNARIENKFPRYRLKGALLASQYTVIIMGIIHQVVDAVLLELDSRTTSAQACLILWQVGTVCFALSKISMGIFMILKARAAGIQRSKFVDFLDKNLFITNILVVPAFAIWNAAWSSGDFLPIDSEGTIRCVYSVRLLVVYVSVVGEIFYQIGFFILFYLPLRDVMYAHVETERKSSVAPDSISAEAAQKRRTENHKIRDVVMRNLRACILTGLAVVVAWAIIILSQYHGPEVRLLISLGGSLVMLIDAIAALNTTLPAWQWTDSSSVIGGSSMHESKRRRTTNNLPLVVEATQHSVNASNPQV